MNTLLARAARSRAFSFFLPPLLLLILLCRDRQNLLRAEFYAEDGWAWYPQAYTHGIASLLTPEGGYLNTAQRLAALLAQLVPLPWAPTLLNLCAFAVQAGLVLFLLSARLDEAWPQRGARAMFALLFAAMPAAHETFGILTNAHWYLALFAFLVLAAAPPRHARDQTLDASILLLAGLSGPFCLFLLPMAAQQWWHHPDRARALRAALLLGCAVVQAAFLLWVGKGRADLPLGATPILLFKIITLIPVYAETGTAYTAEVARHGLWQSRMVVAAGTLLTLAVFMLGWRRGPRLLRQFLLFSLLMFAAALYQPLISEHFNQWPLIADQPPAGGRYFVYPMLAWWGTLFALAAGSGATPAAWDGTKPAVWDRVLPAAWVRRGALLLLAVTCLLAISRDWPRWRPDQADAFRAQARAFEAAPAGTRFEFAIKPDGAVPMVLVKKRDGN